jgi:hypothetical protein
MKSALLRSPLCALTLLLGGELTASAILPSEAAAQPYLGQRYPLDHLNTLDAEKRILWARRCALTQQGIDPEAYEPSAVYPALHEYREHDPNVNLSGANSYTGYAHGYQVNLTTVTNLYRLVPAPTPTETRDALRFFQWAGHISRKLVRPQFPTFSTTADLNDPAYVPLYPHPSYGSDCSFYYDRAGTQPASVPVFYIAAFVSP